MTITARKCRYPADHYRLRSPVRLSGQGIKDEGTTDEGMHKYRVTAKAYDTLRKRDTAWSTDTECGSEAFLRAVNLKKGCCGERTIPPGSTGIY